MKEGLFSLIRCTDGADGRGNLVLNENELSAGTITEGVREKKKGLYNVRTTQYSTDQTVRAGVYL